jgi:two-component system response regulator ResD
VPTYSDAGGIAPARIFDALLVDDHEDVRRLVKDRLVANGFEVAEAATGEAALDMLASRSFDVVVLDVHLPGVDGFSVLRTIRQTSQTPVVLLTAAGDEMDRVLGLEIGADDYVVKPFSPRELVARVRAVLRRTKQEQDQPQATIAVGDLVIDLAARTVTLKGEVLVLTPRSFDLLAFLAARPGRTFSRDELLQKVWKSEPEWQNAATVTEHIHRLRRQIEENPDAPLHLMTVRGSGYRFDP